MLKINSVQDLFLVLNSHGLVFMYSILFVLMFLEGPVVTYLASFASSLGYLDIRIIFLLSIFGNQIPDIVLYFIGVSLKKKQIKKISSFLGNHTNKINWLEKNLKNHSMKTISSFKIIPNLPIPGLILCGFIGLPFKKFFWQTLIINILSSVIFIILGFYSGIAVGTFLKNLKIIEYFFPIAIISSILVYFLIKILYSKFSNKLN